MKQKLLSKAFIILAAGAIAAQLCGCSVPAGNVVSGEESLSSAESSVKIFSLFCSSSGYAHLKFSITACAISARKFFSIPSFIPWRNSRSFFRT